MNTILSKTELQKKLKGTPATAEWDVLVAYDEKHLNEVLAKKWKDTGKGLDFKFDSMLNPTHKLHVEQHFDLHLSSPSFKFLSASKNVLLSMVINGTYIATVTMNGIKQPPEKTTIPANAYRLEAALPIAIVRGDGKVTPGDKVIHFDQERKYFLVFHFQNEQANWSVVNSDNQTHDVDEMVKGAAEAMKNKFANKKAFEYIDVSIAAVSNKADPHSDSDTLLPRSFVLSSQPGYLFVFIATKNKPGRDDPQFGHQGSGTIAPVSTGFTAGIFIRHSLFVDFMKSELKRNFTGSLTSIDDGKPAEGVELALKMTNKQSWDLTVPQSMHEYEVGECKVDYTNSPIKLRVYDDVQATCVADLTWEASTEVVWHATHKTPPATYFWGKVKISSDWKNPAKTFYKIVGDELRVGLDISATEVPTMTFEAMPVTNKDRGHLPRMEVPPFFKEKVQFKLPSNLSCQFKGLNFFSAQNVFVPGVRFIKATEVMLPHDAVILGTMPQVEEKRGAASAVETAYGQLEQQKPPVPLSKFLDDIYRDNYFFGDLVRAAMDGKPDEVSAIIHAKGFDIKEGEPMATILKLSKPGPDFDIRYAGGAYKITNPSDLPYKELFVHSCLRTVHLDGKNVESQKQLVDGSITFNCPDRKQSFQITFACNSDPKHPHGGESFSGTTWPTGHPEQKTPINGQRTFPWSGGPDSEPPREDSPRDVEAFKHLCVAFDLMKVDIKADTDDVAEEDPSNLPLWALGFGMVITILLNLIAALRIWPKHMEAWMHAYQSLRTVIDKKYKASLKYTFKIPGVQVMESEFRDKAEMIVNGQINKGVTDKTKILETAKSEMLKYAEEWYAENAELKVRNRYETAFVVDPELGKTELRSLVELQTAKNLSGAEYEAYMEALTSRVLAVNEKDLTVRNRQLMTKRINDLMLEIEDKQKAKTKQEEALVAVQEKARKEGWDARDVKKIEEEYRRRIDAIESDMKKKRGDVEKDQKEKRSSEGELEKREGEVEEAHKHEEQKLKEWQRKK